MELQDAFAFIQKFCASPAVTVSQSPNTPSGQSAFALIVLLKEYACFVLFLQCNNDAPITVASDLLPTPCSSSFSSSPPLSPSNTATTTASKKKNPPPRVNPPPHLHQLPTTHTPLSDFRRQFLKCNSELTSLDMAAKKAADQIKQIRQEARARFS